MNHKITDITDRNKLITSKETNKMISNYTIMIESLIKTEKQT